jgi:hypothetical protein
MKTRRQIIKALALTLIVMFAGSDVVMPPVVNTHYTQEA